MTEPRRPSPLSFEPVEYHLDGDDRVVWVNDAWRFFADENQAPLTTREPVGARLWDLVSDGPTRHLYSAMFERVRASGDPITIDFRCDAPHVRRFLVLTIARREGPRLVLRVTATRLEGREPVPVLDVRARRDERFVTMCSWCKRVTVAGGHWADVEEAAAALGLFRSPTMPVVTHGICEACATRLGGAGRGPARG
jgi:hypothetical protein